jgi:hypothetical protein
MEDLFRFLLLRPAQPADPPVVKTLTPSFAEPGVPVSRAKRAASQYIQNVGPVKAPLETLKFGRAAQVAADALVPGPIQLTAFDKAVKDNSGKNPAEIVADADFNKEEQALADSLSAMKLLSNSSGGDAPGLAKLALGYDAIRRAAGGENPMALRVLSMANFSMDEKPAPPPPKGPPAPPRPKPVDRGEIERIDSLIKRLELAPVTAFQSAERRVEVAPRKTARATAAGGKQQASIASPTPGAQPWLFSSKAIHALPEQDRKVLHDAGLDLGTQPLPTVLGQLQGRKNDLLAKVTLEDARQALNIYKIGGVFSPVTTNDYVGSPAIGLPTGHGNIRPVGIGDLLLVKQHVLRYEGGDLAHVENVLKSEHLNRETRRLERTETTVLQETETTKEETRDTQTTDRFSLQRETSDTIKTDFSAKAGVAVDAKYGPFVEVKANADVSTSTSTESAVKQASEFSKDVVSRSVSKLVERVLERRTTTTITEFEEKYSHGFDNTNGAGHISGYYQWIDKVMQAQVYNYGKRLLFDVTVPEPGTNFILTQTKVTDQGQSLTKPPAFTLSADQITEANYRYWGALYQLTGMEPPPPPYKTISKGYDVAANQDPHESTKSDTLTIDDGYRAKYAYFQRNLMWWVTGKEMFRFLIGSNWIDALGGTTYVTMAGEIGSVAIAYDGYDVELMAATVEIFCERTELAFAAWQLKVHAAITEGYQAKQQAYEQALAQAKAAAGVVISGRNPAFNDRLVTSELRKQCLTLITGQQFDGFGALELSSQGFAQPNLARTADQMPYVRFFEQAFEWEHIVYFYYPYFWGWKNAWDKHMLLDDVDPQFADFLRAGAARVVFPVRPGFEAAIVHYIETGEIWNGGPPPDISSSLYVPIIKEIQDATGAPGNEVPQGDPWFVHLPTTLVRIRPNNDLPEWQKVGEDWKPIN